VLYFRLIASWRAFSNVMSGRLCKHERALFVDRAGGNERFVTCRHRDGAFRVTRERSEWGSRLRR
jgi:hypothetical protein